MKTLVEFTNFLHFRGVSVTLFLEALREWEELPPEERRGG